MNTILYLNTDTGARIPQTTLAGIRRYASARGWEAEAFSSKESSAEAIPALLASRAPVVGCIYECSDDNIAPLSAFRGLPVVYLHAKKTPRGANAARIPTDNAAVAATAFRELSAGRPSAFAIVGHAGGHRWSAERERVFASLAEADGAECRTFPHRRAEVPSARAQRLATWVAALPRRAAIFAVNDVVAAEVIAAAKASYRSIPRELTLLSVDNLPHICDASRPTISSIQIDFERAGYVAASMIGELYGTTWTSGNHKTSHPRGHSCPRYPSPFSIGPLMAVRRESTSGWGRHEAFVLQAVERIRREACDGLTAADLAKDFPGSRWLFEMRFREAIGHSVLEEIQHVRLEKVCTLLSQTDTAIGSISEMCGYRTEIALKWIFRKRMGVSMKEWRERNRSV